MAVALDWETWRTMAPISLGIWEPHWPRLLGPPEVWGSRAPNLNDLLFLVVQLKMRVFCRVVSFFLGG